MSAAEWVLALTLFLTVGVLLYGMYEMVMLWARRDRRQLDQRLQDYTRHSDYWQGE